MTDKLKSLTPLVTQMTLRKLGMFSSSYMGNDIYFLVEAINLLISDVGEDFVKKEYEKQGKDWDKIKEEFEKLNKLSVNAKTWYDGIANKKFDKREVNKVQSMFKKFFLKTASKMALTQRNLYDLFVFLVKQTTIQRNQIPNEAFKVLEHVGYRKLDLKKSPGQSGIVKQ